MIPPIHLLRVQAVESDDIPPCAVVSVEATPDGMWRVRLARGTSFDALMGGTEYEPVSSDSLADTTGYVLEQLVNEGFIQSSAAELLLKLRNATSATIRARAAVRLGWRREKKAAEFLLSAAATNNPGGGEICPIIDALGLIGDQSAIPLIREIAAKKNLSRRRSGVEALRNLGDQDGLQQAIETNTKRLPEGLRLALQSVDESKVTKAAVLSIEEAIADIDSRRYGAIADDLYERNTPLASRLVRRMIDCDAVRGPHRWRYAKSILKRAILRRDAVTFGKLAYTIERASVGYRGETAVVKSGRDGQKRSTSIFGKKTQAYIRRLTWRHLSDLARYEPEKYTEHASQTLCHYTSSDAGKIKGNYGAFADAFLLQRILFGASDRLVVNWHSARVRYANADAVELPGTREEAFAELWDKFPAPFLTLLSKSQLHTVQDFAFNGLKRHPELLKDAPLKTLFKIAASDHLFAVERTQAEIRNRLESASKPWELLKQILAEGLHSLRTLSSDWLERTASTWVGEPQELLFCLQLPDPKIRTEATKVAIKAVSYTSASYRKNVATVFLAHIQKNKGSESNVFASVVEFATTALAEELDTLVTPEELMNSIRDGDLSSKKLMSFLLARRVDAFALLGMDGLVWLANHELIGVRRAGYTILKDAPNDAVERSGVLYELAESDWEDTRKIAFGKLREVPFERLGSQTDEDALDGRPHEDALDGRPHEDALDGRPHEDALMRLCDSSRADVQEFGRELVLAHFSRLDVESILFRLAEHPAEAMRTFIFSLFDNHLPKGVEALRQINAFLRSTLFEVRPRRRLKVVLLHFLSRRAIDDEESARYVADVLNDLLRTETVFDFQLISQILAHIQHRYPQIITDLRMNQDFT